MQVVLIFKDTLLGDMFLHYHMLLRILSSIQNLLLFACYSTQLVRLVVKKENFCNLFMKIYTFNVKEQASG